MKKSRNLKNLNFKKETICKLKQNQIKGGVVALQPNSKHNGCDTYQDHTCDFC